MIPRQWFMFSGRITKPFGYFVSLANGFDTVSMLDVFLDLDYDPRLRVRAGRFKTPFTYEFFVEPDPGPDHPRAVALLQQLRPEPRPRRHGLRPAVQQHVRLRRGHLQRHPQRLRRAYRLQVHLLVHQLEAVRQRRRLAPRELQHRRLGLRRQRAPRPVPAALRTIVPTAGNAVVGVPFLAFNNNVRQTGILAFWDLHAAWFYSQLALIGEWESGFQDYALTSNLAARTHLPVQSFYVQAGYLLTGETRSSVGIVKPPTRST